MVTSAGHSLMTCQLLNIVSCSRDTGIASIYTVAGRVVSIDRSRS
jgi:hypothetical protein